MADDLLGLLVDRRATLARLDAGPVGKPALVADLDVSRSTVDRAVRDLASHELAAPVDGEDGERRYRTTLAGTMLHDCLDRFAGEVAAVAEAASLLAHCDPDAPCSPAFLAGAEVVRATPPAPVRALDRVATALSSADRYRGFARSEPRSGLTDTLLGRCVSGELTAELVAEDDLLDHVVGEHTAAVESAVRGGHLRLHTAPSLPYGLGVADPDDPADCFAAIVVDDPELRGIVATEDPDAVAWADALVDRYVAEAVSLVPDG